MTTTKTLLRQFVKPTIEEHPGFVLRGIWLYYKPIHHVARAILIDRTSGKIRSIRWFAVTLFQMHQNLDFRYGCDLYRQGLWYLDSPGAPHDFLQEVETKVLPSFHALDTLEAYHAFADIGFETWPWRSDVWALSRLSGFPARNATVLAAMGRFDEARAVCRTLPQSYGFAHPDLGRDARRVLTELYPLLLDEDRPALARVLRSWEEITIRLNKLEDLWEPTPFPFEEA